MIAGDLRDRARQWTHDVGAVQPPAEPDLDHGDLGAAGGEVGEGDRRAGFEERRLALEDEWPELVGPHCDSGLGDRHTVDPDPLPERDQMGRRVQAHPPARLGERGGHEGADTALSVRAADMDGRHGVVRVAQRAQQRARGGEPELDGRRPGEEELECFVVGQGHVLGLRHGTTTPHLALPGGAFAVDAARGQLSSACSSCGRWPCMWRSRRAVVSRRDPRGTTSSICPCSSRNSAV